jgi:hypothetical protein
MFHVQKNLYPVQKAMNKSQKMRADREAKKNAKEKTLQAEKGAAPISPVNDTIVQQEPPLFNAQQSKAHDPEQDRAEHEEAEKARLQKEQQQQEKERDEKAQAEEKQRKLQPVAGSCVVRYNHYKNEHSITISEANPKDGRILVARLDEMFSFSAVYKGNFQTMLRGPGRGGDMLSHTDDSGTEFIGLENGAEYFCEVREDEVAETAARGGKEKVVFTASKGSSHIKTGETEMGEDSASCSCIEGNPCAVAYNCKDWNNRFDIAKKNGWKGF